MPVLERYHALVAAGELKPDPDQAAAAVALQAVQAALEAVPPRGSTVWRFLGKKPDEIARIALETVQGHLRAILGTLSVEDIYKNRDQFAQKVQEISAGDLANMGFAEAADVLFHLMVLLDAKGVPLREVLAELDRREGTSGIEEKASRSE